jgi:hypothetical protein
VTAEPRRIDVGLPTAEVATPHKIAWAPSGLTVDGRITVTTGITSH